VAVVSVDEPLGSWTNARPSDGLRTPPERPLQSPHDFVLLSDDENSGAQALIIEATRNLVEPAGAAPLAAALHMREQLAGKRAALVLSGGNATRRQFLKTLASDRTVATRAPK
jgi:threonine dehydratase